MTDDDRDDRFEIPPVYDPPVFRHRADPLTGRSILLTLCILGVVIGLGTTGPPPWLLHTITIVSALGLCASAWWWWRAVTAPSREKW